MTQITNDIEFKRAIGGLDYAQQRELAGQFVKNVLELSADERIARVVETALDAGASADELANALKSARAAMLDSYTRCGAEGDWKEQAGYFVARAAVAALTPEAQNKVGDLAWQAAISSRMARISMLIDSENNATSEESDHQYRILTEYLNT